MARADIYRCIAPDGKTLYGDAPCPRGAVHNSNITTAVGACTTAECAAKREQLAGKARERLRAEQEQLAQFTDRRQRNEIAAENERARLDTLLWRQSVDARLAVMANEPGNAIAYAPYYPIYPVYPILKPCGWRCGGLHQRAVNTGPVRRTWGTAIRLDRR
jgi:outer membrane murein-binding lipoprotein Lpp